MSATLVNFLVLCAIATALASQTSEEPLLTFEVQHKFPPLSVSRVGLNVSRVKRISQAQFVKGDILQYVAQKRKPVVITNSAAASWGALHWDLWKMAITSWRTLENVLSLDTFPCSDTARTNPTHCSKDSLYPHATFFIHEEGTPDDAHRQSSASDGSSNSIASGPPGGVIRSSAAGSTAVAPKLLKEVSMLEFLETSFNAARSDDGGDAVEADAEAGKQSRPKKRVKFAYSTDYDILEEELHVRKTKKSLSFRFFHVMFSYVLLCSFACTKAAK
jgi:hypothetical protein